MEYFEIEIFAFLLNIRSKDKDKARKSKSQPVDQDSQLPPELELMETGEIPAISSDAEASLNADPEPLPPPDMDISTDPGKIPCCFVIHLYMSILL